MELILLMLPAFFFIAILILAGMLRNPKSDLESPLRYRETFTTSMSYKGVIQAIINYASLNRLKVEHLEEGAIVLGEGPSILNSNGCYYPITLVCGPDGTVVTVGIWGRLTPLYGPVLHQQLQQIVNGLKSTLECFK